MALVPLVLVFIQPDIGTSIVMVAIVAGMFLVAGVSGRQIAALVVICIVLIAAAFQLGVVKEYQLDRLRAFLDRENTPADVRYNLDQAEIAVGSGGLVGQGFLHGRQTTLDYVPEQHTDFIFTVAGEEFGFVGASFVLLLYAVLLWRAIRIAFLSKDPFGTYLATGVASMFAIQMFVNIGMVIGIMPITGSPPVPVVRGLDARELPRCGDPAERACVASSRHAGARCSGSSGSPNFRAPVLRGAGEGLVETRQRKTDPAGLVCSSVTSPSIARADILATVRPSPRPDGSGCRLLGLLERFVKIRSSASSDPGPVIDHCLDPGLRSVTRSRPDRGRRRTRGRSRRAPR